MLVPIQNSHKYQYKLKTIDKNDRAIGGTDFHASRNIIFAIVKITLAIISQSLWFLANGVFYILIAITRIISVKDYLKIMTNYAGSLVSIVTTQVVLTNEFYTGTDSMINQYNGLVGIIVSLVIILTGAYMIIKIK